MITQIQVPWLEAQKILNDERRHENLGDDVSCQFNFWSRTCFLVFDQEQEGKVRGYLKNLGVELEQ